VLGIADDSVDMAISTRMTQSGPCLSNTPDQRDREYTVMMYLTEDGLRLPHVIHQPFVVVGLFY